MSLFLEGCIKVVISISHFQKKVTLFCNELIFKVVSARVSINNSVLHKMSTLFGTIAVP